MRSCRSATGCRGKPLSSDWHSKHTFFSKYWGIAIKSRLIDSNSLCLRTSCGPTLTSDLSSRDRSSVFLAFKHAGGKYLLIDYSLMVHVIVEESALSVKVTCILKQGRREQQCLPTLPLRMQTAANWCPEAFMALHQPNVMDPPKTRQLPLISTTLSDSFSCTFGAWASRLETF